MRLTGDQKTALTGDSLYLKDVKMIVHFLGHALLYCAPHFHKCGHIIATCHTYMPECGASIRWNKYVSRFDTTLHTLHIQGTYSQSFLVPFSESTVWENFEEKKKSSKQSIMGMKMHLGHFKKPRGILKIVCLVSLNKDRLFWIRSSHLPSIKTVAFISGKKIQHTKKFLFVFPLK